MVKKEKGGIFLSGEKKKRMEFLANYLELPKDLLMNLPRITLLGDMQLHTNLVLNMILPAARSTAAA
jgi:hypothetical protein